MKPKQAPMFNKAEDTPLFSGTPQQVRESVFDPKPTIKQAGLFNCPVCRDTGEYNGCKCLCLVVSE